MKFGEMELFLVEDGYFRLDGGGMFGVVPKVLWSKSDPPDEKNRILLGANCLVVKSGDEVVLVDNGLGGKWDSKRADMFAVDLPRKLLPGLEQNGVGPGDVTRMIYSHLHFDHAGGGTFLDSGSRPQPQFPRATHYIQRGEWETANHPNPRDRASYLPENLEPLAEAGLVELVDGDAEIIPGVKMIVTGGHTRHHCVIQVTSGGATAIFLADLIPTPSHLHVPFVMGYDLDPETTMTMKQQLLEEAYRNRYLLIFEHGPKLKAGHLDKNDKGRWMVNKVDMDQPAFE